MQDMLRKSFAPRISGTACECIEGILRGSNYLLAGSIPVDIRDIIDAAYSGDETAADVYAAVVTVMAVMIVGRKTQTDDIGPDGSGGLAIGFHETPDAFTETYADVIDHAVPASLELMSAAKQTQSATVEDAMRLMHKALLVGFCRPGDILDPSNGGRHPQTKDIMRCIVAYLGWEALILEQKYLARNCAFN